MFRKSVVPMAVALGLFAAPLAHAQGASTTPSDAKATAPSTQAAPAAKAPAKAHAMRHTARVDINSATREQLMKLPGIGDATADKIIAARPFKTKAELLSKGLVTKAEYAKLSGHVIAKQEPTAAK